MFHISEAQGGVHVWVQTLYEAAHTDLAPSFLLANRTLLQSAFMRISRKHTRLRPSSRAMAIHKESTQAQWAVHETARRQCKLDRLSK